MGTRFLSVEDFQLSFERCHSVKVGYMSEPIRPWLVFVSGLRIPDLNVFDCFVFDLMIGIGCLCSFVVADQLENFDRRRMLEC